MKKLLEKIRKILRDRRIRTLLTHVVSMISAITVFVTTYALILPAITLEKQAACGIEEHQHTDECYEEELICDLPESEGHQHTDSCYAVKSVLSCDVPEHVHDEDCYDENGELVCKKYEHSHDGACYQEVKELVCGIEESDGHTHDASCYEKVLTCGKEVHVHSAECYKTEDDTDSQSEDGNESDPAAADDSREDDLDDAWNRTADDSGNASIEDDADTVQNESADNYIPELDPMNMDAMLNDHTDVYYLHGEEGEELPANSSDITEWMQVENDTELTLTDLVKLYFAYTIPAGSLNETNPTARYRLPENIHLTDEQIEAIKKNENGFAAGYDKSSPEYQYYLGAEAIEGIRKPDEQLTDGEVEYISAIVSVEKIYDDAGEYIGQDLIFTFIPYTIEKNQKTYDAEQNLLSAGEKVTGWFAYDFNLDQIDWEEEETVHAAEEGETVQAAGEEETVQAAEEEETAEAQPAEPKVEKNIIKTADIIFAEKDDRENIKEISRSLKLVEKKVVDVSEEDSQEEGVQEFKSGTLTSNGDGYRIRLDYTEEAQIPEDASLSVREITAETDKEAYESCLAQTRKHISESGDEKSEVDTQASRFFDIEIVVTDEDGTSHKIEPAVPVSVNIYIEDVSDDTSDSESASKDLQNTDPTVLHFGEGGVEQMESTADSDKKDDTAYEGGEVTEISFEAESFSIYGLVYTVDLSYSVNGKSFRFSLPGGGFVSLTELVEVLGITGDANSSDDENIDASENAAEGDKNDSAAAPLTLDNVIVSEATRKFVADVESVGFSSPKLVWVGKAESDRTVGGLKEANGLECQYSAELTEEQIAEINAQTVEAGDWALISVQPFTSEETLTVTMKNGEVFTIRVTDAQISTNVLTADGISFKITVTYDEDAELPEGTKLEADEIEHDTEEYLQYLGRTWSEVNRTHSESESQIESDNEASEVKNINVNMARFFDLKLVYQDEEIEPKAPVQVEITYTDGLLMWDNTKPGVVHFTKEGNVEILEEVKTDVEGDAVVSFHYEQDSFSVIGTYIQQATHDVETPPHVSKFTPVSTSAAMRSISSDDIGKGEGSSVIPPIALRGTDGQESSYENDDSGLPYPTGNKTLEPNDDGTYTLTLSVKGNSQSVIRQQQKKANVLFVMDRSSSMITNTVSDEEQFWYYGTWNTDETTFRGDIHPGTGYAFYGVIDGEYVELNTDYEPAGWWESGHWDWGQYHLRYDNGSTLVNYPENYPIYVKSKTTRLYAEQEALDEVIDNLLSYNTSETPDSVEIALISFAYRRGDLNAWASETEHTGWVTGVGENDDLQGLLNAVDSTRYASGTNWEEALQYAYEVISDKEQAEAGKPEEDYYVIFLTDGEPTNTANASNEEAGRVDNMDAYNAAREEARNLANYHFYNIFTYRNPDKENDIYSVYLTNYAYNQGTDPNDDRENDYVKEYYSDAQTIDALKDKLGHIFQTIADVIGHADVSITDTLTTDAMTTTIVQGKTNGYVYTVKDTSGTVLYTVTATGDIGSPTVTFNVPASATKNYIAESTEVGGKTLYSVTTAEGDEYRMALADVNTTTGELEWDLSPVGILMNDCTYSVSFVVWPDQEAYDYVAGLNNRLDGYTWDTSPENETYQDLTDTKGFEIGGVSRFPSIVKYPDGTFAVLTNTDQKIHYSVVEMETVNGQPNGDPTIHGPYYQDLETPDPMELTSTETKLQKAWGIERNPSTLAQLLYDEDGNPTQFKIKYGIKIVDQEETETDSEGSDTGQENPDDGQGNPDDGQGNPDTGQENPDDGQENPDDDEDESPYYTTLTLGWDGTKYDWDQNSVRYVLLNGNSGPSVPVGTSWSKDFAIATGLMLSDARMDALGLDKDKYGPPYRYGSTDYYILETGHDYTIEEIIPEDAPRDAYEFDFDAPTYHPMLVDGKLKSVTFNRDEQNNAIISIKEISKEDWLVSLKIENNLRGYIRLEKDIVDKDGRTPLPTDNTEFEYEIDIKDPLHPGRFTGTHIPWYGVDGLFYHSTDEDGNFHYFQAETNTIDHKAHEFTLTTESGAEYPAVCIDETTGEIFDEDVVGPTLIQYEENGVTKQISLYGNQMEHIDDNNVKAVMKINQNQVLDIANVPSKSTYTIKETDQEGYNFVNIRREIRSNNRVESGSTFKGSTTITGRIVPDRDNHIIYTNKVYSVDLTVKKTDENDKPLTGAVFSLYKKNGENWPDDPMSVKPGNDEDDTAVYEFINLPDGSYKLVETPPTGYDAVDDVFFTVANGVLSIDGTLPEGVTKDENKLILTVKNKPREDALTVRKQWLDFEGNPREYDGTLDLKLEQWVQNAPKVYNVDVDFRYTGNGSGGYSNSTSSFTTRSGSGNGNLTINWGYNNSTNSVESITVTDQHGTHYESSIVTSNTYYRSLTIPNISEDKQITVLTQNWNWSGYQNDRIGQLQFSNTDTVSEGYTSTGGTKTLTLGANGTWSQQFILSGDGLLSDNSTTLPATYNGKNCYYTIAEESVPEGYELTQISSEPVQSGVLTAYNQRTTEDVDVTVRKVWEDGLNEDGTVTSHQDNLVVTLSNGQSVTLNEGNQWTATVTGLPKYDEEGDEIAYSWTEDELENGYYLSDSNTVVYDNSVTTTLTNSYSDHYMPEMEIDGVKIWDDDGTGTRPASITVKLYKDGVLYKTTTVNPPTGENVDSNRWTFKFTNLPIFNTDENGDATGTLAVYTIEEILPAGYTSDYDTTIQQMQAAYEAGTAEAHIINSYTAENQLVCEGADLGFVVVRHGQGYVVWTPRPLIEGELDKIKQAAVGASSQFSGIMNASGDSLTIISGVPKTVKVGNKEAATVYMKDGDVWVRFKSPSAQSDIVYGSIPYTYTQIGGEGGVTITNVRKTTSVSGTKTWIDGGRQHNNSEQITLKLFRTTRPVTDDSQWEEVQLTATGTISLSWDGDTYTYSNLPRFSDYTSDPPIEYEYRVEETAVNVTEGTGTGQHTISYMMEADGNNFINTELINIEATKTWKDAGAYVNAR